MLLGGLRTEFNRKRAMKPEVPHGSHGFRLVPDGEFCHTDLAFPSATDFQFTDAADSFTFLPFYSFKVPQISQIHTDFYLFTLLPLKVPQAVPSRKTWRGL